MSNELVVAAGTNDKQLAGQVGGQTAELVTRVNVERRAALEMLISGKTVAESALAAGVTRQAVYKWLRKDPVFRAAYNQWHAEMEESTRSRMLVLADSAASAVQKAIDGGDAKIAYAVLRDMGFTKPGVKIRVLEPEETKQLQEMEDLTVKTELKKRISRLKIEGQEADRPPERREFGRVGR